MKNRWNQFQDKGLSAYFNLLCSLLILYLLWPTIQFIFQPLFNSGAADENYQNLVMKYSIFAVVVLVAVAAHVIFMLYMGKKINRLMAFYTFGIFICDRWKRCALSRKDFL